MYKGVYASKEDFLLGIRFDGPALENNSVPIYELGQSLVSVQRIIHRAYLFQEKRLATNAVLTSDERQRIALQLSAHESGSDIYGFVAFLSDPLVSDILGNLISTAITALTAYAWQQVTRRKAHKLEVAQERADSDSNQPLVGAIYREVVDLASRIDNVGGIREIEIFRAGQLGLPEVRFDENTKRYVKQIQNEPFLGDLQEITGTVRRLAPQNEVAEILLGSKKVVKVHLETGDFSRIRYDAKPDAHITFTGRPIYRLGSETSRYEEFEAYSISLSER